MPICIRYLLSIILIAGMSWQSDAQDELCSGSLGDNIFEEGDFGRGPDVIYPRDPGLAPGYMYTTITPVHDGQYILTNDISKWWDNWPSWLRIGDRSPDTDGYMMVVNASFEPGIFYDQFVDGVCENTLYEFSADVINLVSRHTGGHHDPNVSFLIDGKVKFNTGNIRQDEQWRTVGFTFKTKTGQNSVRLTLRNNAPGGTGNDLALDNISFRACGPNARIDSDSPDVICEDEEFPIMTAIIETRGERFVRWQMRQRGNRNWSDMGLTDKTIQADPLPPGEYEYRFVHAGSEVQLESEKCRAASEVRYLVVKPAEYHTSMEIGYDDEFVFGDRHITESGIYRLSYPRLNGCDSVVVLDLIVAPPPEGVEPVVMASAVEEKPPVRPPLSAAIDVYEHLSCHGEGNGSLRVVCEGGDPPYKVKWSNGSTSGINNRLAAGKYDVTVTDASGATYVAIGELPEPEKLTVTLTNIKPADKGKANGSATLRTELKDIYYEWDSGVKINVAYNLRAGTHAVTVSNAHGCEMIVYCTIPEREPEPIVTPELTAEALRSGATIRMERLHFDADSSTIKKESIPSLLELYRLMDDNPELIIEIGGHTNGLPEHDYCDRLSTARAKAVAEWIVLKGIREDRVFYKGYGKRQPIASNRSLEGRRRNQRVEVRMIGNE